VFQRLAEVAEVSKLSKEDRQKYDHALKRYRDTLNAMTGAEIKGREEGREEGRAEGRAEGKVEVARNMKSSGMSLADIVRFTGLTEEQVNAL
jgi:predicted transposase/invertase (TIGR01784 family)